MRVTAINIIINAIYISFNTYRTYARNNLNLGKNRMRPTIFSPADGNNWSVCELLEELHGAPGNKATHNRTLSIHIALHEVGVLKPSKRITILLTTVVRTLLCEARKKG